jgi:hypothetical protein
MTLVTEEQAATEPTVWFELRGRAKHGFTADEQARVDACISGTRVQRVWFLSSPPQLRVWCQFEASARQIKDCIDGTGSMRELKLSRHDIANYPPDYRPPKFERPGKPRTR